MASSHWGKHIGPGIVLAATGLGAGDLIAAAVAGARYGTILVWVIVLGALLKFVLNEGIARWQLVTGHTLIDGMAHHLPAWARWYFFLFLLLWSFVVSGALMAACGLAAHALQPALSVAQWGLIHALVAVAFVWIGRYQWLENLMKALIAAMFAVALYCAFQVAPPIAEIAPHLFLPRLPDHSLTFVLSIMGGIGGSVTVLCYGYWINEKQWRGPAFLNISRVDLLVAYALTAAFGVAIMVLAAGVQPEVVQGKQMALALAQQLHEVLGDTGQRLFLWGFWAAVFSSMLGVYQGVPSLIVDALKHQVPSTQAITDQQLYHAALVLIALPAMALLFVSKPVWLVIAYAVLGSLFMPFLALVLLYLNRAKLLNAHANGWGSKIGLTAALALFTLLLGVELHQQLQGI